MVALSKNTKTFYNSTIPALPFSGDFTLDINPVSLEDDARFQCQVGAAEGVAPIRSRYATLSVLVPPEPPVITSSFAASQSVNWAESEREARTVEGNEVELRCESKGGKPASEVRYNMLTKVIELKN